MSDLLILPFTRTWYIIITSFVAYGFCILYLGNKCSNKWKGRILSFMGYYLLIDFAVYEGYVFYHGIFSLKTSLPLAYCSIMQIMAGYGSIRRSQFCFEFCILLGVIGPLQAFVSPAVVCKGQEYLMIEYFIAHGLTIMVPLFMVFCMRYEPRKKLCIQINITYASDCYMCVFYKYISGF